MFRCETDLLGNRWYFWNGIDEAVKVNPDSGHVFHVIAPTSAYGSFYSIDLPWTDPAFPGTERQRVRTFLAARIEQGYARIVR